MTPTQLTRKKTGMNSQGKQSLRVWLQLLGLTTIIEKKIRRRLSKEFETTLPRFDVLATLEHAHGKMTMGELSRHLLVSKGNVTGVVANLVEQGLVKKENSTEDRRTQYLSLTPHGAHEFEKLAKAHQGWIEDLFSGLEEKSMAGLLEKLGQLKTSLTTNAKGEGA